MSGCLRVGRVTFWTQIVYLTYKNDRTTDFVDIEEMCEGIKTIFFDITERAEVGKPNFFH